MKKIKKTAGFWIRILSVLIDLLIFCLVAIPLSLIAIKKEGEKLIIIDWGYYLWMTLIVIIILVQFILMPILLKGRTIGMLFCRINIISLINEPIWLIVLKRNQIHAFLWIFCVLISMSFISPSLAQKINEISNQSKNGPLKLNELELVMITIPGTTSGIVIFLNSFSLLVINMNRNRFSINDKITNTKMVYSNKEIEVFDEKNKIILREKITKQKLIFKD